MHLTEAEGLHRHFWGHLSEEAGHGSVLADLVCRKAEGQEKPYRLPEECGLYLYMLPSGHKSWRLGYWHLGAKKRIVLGSYPEMTFQGARETARTLSAKGEVPTVHRRQQRADWTKWRPSRRFRSN